MQQSLKNQKEKEDNGKDDPALSKVIERNIRTIIHLRTKAARESSLQGRWASDCHFFTSAQFSFALLAPLDDHQY